MDDQGVIIGRAVERLRGGGLVAFPTETVYGLGADALNPAAVALAFRVKGRPPGNPLIMHVTGQGMARHMSSQWPQSAQQLAETFWPGPLTIVVPKADVVPSMVTAGGAGVAVRCPDHPIALALLEAFGSPLVGPSANRSGMLSPTTAAHVRDAFDQSQVMVIDGGPCRAGIESTVVSLTGARPVVLRRGVISALEIAAVLGTGVESAPPAPDEAGPLPSPGMLARHYAPRSPARVFTSDQWPALLEREPGPVVVLTHVRSRHVGEPHRLIHMPDEAPSYAAALYASMHEADALGPALIAIERPDGVGPLWDAVRDRLERATS